MSSGHPLEKTRLCRLYPLVFLWVTTRTQSPASVAWDRVYHTNVHHRLHFTSLNSINIQQNKTGQVSLLQQSKRNWRPGTGRHRSLVPHINSTSSSSYWCGVFCSAQQGMATDVCLNPLNVGMFFFYHSAITNVVTLHFGERVCSSHLLTLQMKACGDTNRTLWICAH